MRPIIMMAISAHRSVALLVAATAAGILDDDSRAFRAHLDERRRPLNNLYIITTN